MDTADSPPLYLGTSVNGWRNGHIKYYNIRFVNLFALMLHNLKCDDMPEIVLDACCIIKFDSRADLVIRLFILTIVIFDNTSINNLLCVHLLSYVLSLLVSE